MNCTARACQHQLYASTTDVEAVEACLDAFDHRDVLEGRYAAQAVGTALSAPARLLMSGFGW